MASVSVAVSLPIELWQRLMTCTSSEASAPVFVDVARALSQQRPLIQSSLARQATTSGMGRRRASSWSNSVTHAPAITPLPPLHSVGPGPAGTADAGQPFRQVPAATTSAPKRCGRATGSSCELFVPHEVRAPAVAVPSPELSASERLGPERLSSEELCDDSLNAPSAVDLYDVSERQGDLMEDPTFSLPAADPTWTSRLRERRRAEGRGRRRPRPLPPP
ncbi:hypothetical protein BD626DRAFT_578734 [Schizophyllum amplum]|uniref:Uncharacterized protein n=1 Tax=Schizophyllum amplum TaxID=97359 RepID=A0A550BRV7_9AGAR|nr:hypothetical protein BD626DRAFT_578734 [Auriculariopsis ampla]